MFKREKRFWACLLLVLIVMVVTGWDKLAEAQEKYPTRYVDILCPFAPGASTDAIGRITADAMKRKWGVPMNVINKPGGATIPCTLEVYRAEPDGYTVMQDSQSSCPMQELAIRNLPFKVLDRTFVAMTALTPTIFVVPSSSPFKNMKDLEHDAKKDPSNFSWSSFGGTGGVDLAMRNFCNVIGLDVLKTKPINVKGGSESVSMTAGGHLKVGITTAMGALAAFKSGMIRPVGITGDSRHPLYPDLPTMTEQGLPRMNISFWLCISGPPNLPSHIINRWNETLQEVLKDPEVISRMEKIACVPFYLNSEDCKKYVAKELDLVRKLWGLK